MESKKKKVIVIGAGFSGLVTGFYLVEQGFAVHFYEKKSIAGGLLGSYLTEGGVVEQAANAFIANQELERISHIINVPLYEKKAQARKRFIFRNGKPRRWPIGFFASLRVFYFLISYIFFSRFLKPQDGLSLKDWGDKHLGKEATEYLLSTAMQGIYGTSADSLSASLVLRSLFSKEKTRTGALKGSVSPERGMGEWTEGMKKYLQEQGCEFSFDSDWRAVSLDKPLVLAVHLESAKEILAELKDSRYKMLQPIEALSLTSVTVHMEKDSGSVVSGFGCLFPTCENFNAIGVLSNGHIFQGRSLNCLSETWIFNDSSKKVSEMSKDQMIVLITQDRTRMGRERTKIKSSHHFQWVRAIPHYGLTLEKNLEGLSQVENNVFLVGNYLGQLGLSRILNIAKSGARAVIERGQWQKKV